MGTSYTRSIKTGPGQRMVRRTSASGKFTTTKVQRTNLGNGDYLTSRYSTNSPTPKKTRFSRPSSRKSSRSKSIGDGGVTLVLGLFVALIAIVSWLNTKLYTWFQTRQKKPE